MAVSGTMQWDLRNFLPATLAARTMQLKHGLTERKNEFII
jgi:hypothetical protein